MCWDVCLKCEKLTGWELMKMWCGEITWSESRRKYSSLLNWWACGKNKQIPVVNKSVQEKCWGVKTGKSLKMVWWLESTGMPKLIISLQAIAPYKVGVTRLECPDLFKYCELLYIYLYFVYLFFFTYCWCCFPDCLAEQSLVCFTKAAQMLRPIVRTGFKLFNFLNCTVWTITMAWCHFCTDVVCLSIGWLGEVSLHFSILFLLL